MIIVLLQVFSYEEYSNKISMSSVNSFSIASLILWKLYNQEKGPTCKKHENHVANLQNNVANMKFTLKFVLVQPFI